MRALVSALPRSAAPCALPNRRTLAAVHLGQAASPGRPARGPPACVRSTMVASLLAFVLISTAAGGAHALPSQCSACRAVADELQQRLEEEAPRNDIDLRHRLDKDGKRYGRMISWRVSELRVIELLETLCSTVSSEYELAPVSNTTGAALAWEPSNSLPAGPSGASHHERKEQRKQLEVWCAGLLEDEEERLSEALRSDGETDVHALLCAGRCGGGGEAAGSADRTEL